MADNDKEYMTEERDVSEEREMETELSEVKNRLAYLAAEFDNYKKRVARERESLVAFGNERLLLSLLPVLDNLELAMAQGANGPKEALLEGVKITYGRFLSDLKKFGVDQIAVEGGMFDPNLHEAIARVPWEGKPEGTVVNEARKGYMLNGRLLRPAQVTVTRGEELTREKSKDGDGGSAETES